MLGKALRLLRIFHGLSQTEAAKTLGISKSCLSEIESGDKTSAPALLQKYADAFELPLSSIIFFAENVSNDSSYEKARTIVASKIVSLMYLFFPVKGRSYISNAVQHANNHFVKCLDVKRYFPSTTSKRVFLFLRKIIGCEKDLAGLLTSLPAYKGHLPTGSPLSPIMAYYAHAGMWESIAVVAKANGCTLTVYIDDITISGPKVRSNILWFIKQAIHRNELPYHNEKPG